MLFFDRIDVSERTDVNKTSESKEWDICLYRYFSDEDFKCKPKVCNGWCELSVMSMNVSNIAISNIKSGDYRCIISWINKSEATNLLQNIDLTEKRGAL